MNDENLRSFADLPREVHREISRKGGINSGISRARTKIIEAIVTNVLVNRMLYGEGNLDIGDEIMRLMGLSNEELALETAKIGEEPETIKRMHELGKELDELLDISDLFDD